MGKWLLRFAGASAIALAVLVAGVAMAWTGPTANPPSSNVSAPLNISTTNQSKGNSNNAPAGSSGYLGANGFCISGSCITSWSGVGGGFTGGGTTNYLTKFTGSSALGNSGLEDTGSAIFNTYGPNNFWSSNELDLDGGAGTIFTNSIGGTSGVPVLYFSSVGVGIGAASGYPLGVSGGKRGNWAETVDWPPSNSNQYGLLVGMSSDGYSQFQNASNYYTLIDNGDWGINTNGYIQGAGFYNNANSQWIGAPQASYEVSSGEQVCNGSATASCSAGGSMYQIQFVNNGISGAVQWCTVNVWCH